MSETRYALVAREITNRIASGQQPVGSTLPTEITLAEQFGVSRATIRNALRELQQLGLVSRRRNVGTRVEADRVTPDASRFGHSLSSIDDLVQYATETKRVVGAISDPVVDRDLARTLGLQPGRRLLHIETTREIRDGEHRPICWTDIYLDAAFSALRTVIPDHDGLIGTLIEERYGRRIAEIAQSFSAAGVPERMAGALGAEIGAHALEITRHYRDASGAVLLVTVSLHPADRFRYEMRLRRG